MKEEKGHTHNSVPKKRPETEFPPPRPSPHPLGSTHSGQMWSSPLHAHLLLLQPAPPIPALPTKMQPRSEKPLTSVAGVTHTPQTRPRGGDRGAAPGRGTRRAEPRAKLRPGPERRSQSAGGGERAGLAPASRQIVFPGTTFFHFCCGRPRRPEPKRRSLPFPASSTRPASTSPARSSLPSGSSGAGKKFPRRPPRTQPGLRWSPTAPRAPRRLPYLAEAADFPSAELTGPATSTQPVPARRSRLRARSLPQAGAYRYASSQPPLSLSLLVSLSLARPATRGRRRREGRGEERRRREEGAIEGGERVPGQGRRRRRKKRRRGESADLGRCRG